MNFISISYALFLAIAVAIYWSFGQQKLRLWTLLIVSIAFYATLHLRYIPLLLVLIFINFQIGLAIGENISPEQNNERSRFVQADWNSRRIKLLFLGVTINVLLLLGFKYLSPLLNLIKGNHFSTAIVAPLGISFFVFECIAYLVDVYRGAPATHQFVKFAAYKLFFPKLISGPITRFHNLVNQFHNLHLLTAENFSEALWLIAIGAVKKGILADHIGTYVDLCFGNLQRAGSSDLWLATFAYGFQLYLDFSGYVDIARGSALLFGLVLPENFDFPYFSKSIAEFWRRWHMTLGDWLRNYLYFPLGGSRRGLTRTCLNLMIVMLIAGIWHGSTLGFVVWGAYHGLALVVHRVTEAIGENFKGLENFWHRPLGVFTAWLLTQLMVFTSWIWFRLPNLRDSSLVFVHLWGHTADDQFVQKVYLEALHLSRYQLTVVLVALATCMAIVYFFKRQLKLQFSWPVKLFFVIPCLYAVWLLAPEGNLPYIYFDF
jgi:alginate O-acetyltransferase complex protein AlgI